VAVALAGAGADVHLVARSQDLLREVRDETGGRAWPLDLTDDADVWGVLEQLQEALGGPPDVVVNAAGVFDLAPVAETSVEVFDRNLATNLRAPFLVMRALLPGMLARGRGFVVNVGSISGRRAFPGNGAYAASKFGLRGLHAVVLEEIRGTGVRACLVEPAATDTGIWDPFTPDDDPNLPGRADMLRPDDVAQAVLFAVTRPRGVHLPYLAVERS
jgi:NADP-dependent 3-hydroxy acid dehydrogenase YdfG